MNSVRKLKQPGCLRSRETSTRELDRLSRLPSAAAEYGVIRTYLDWLVTLPWSVLTTDTWISSRQASVGPGPLWFRRCKERIIEFLSVRKLRQRERELSQAPKMKYIAHVKVLFCVLLALQVWEDFTGTLNRSCSGRKFVRIRWRNA